MDRIKAVESEIDDLRSELTELASVVTRLSSLIDTPTRRDRDEFASLVLEWKTCRGHSSKVRDLTSHEAYQQIVGMGPKAIPLLLKEMEERPSHWHWAPCAITRANPVPKESMGKLKEMAAIWLKWGRDNGYQW